MPKLQSSVRKVERDVPYPSGAEPRSKRATTHKSLKSDKKRMTVNHAASAVPMKVRARKADEIIRKYQTPGWLTKLNDDSRFFHLPREVRDMIYGCVAVSDEEGTTYVCLQDDNKIRLPTVPGALQVSRRMRSEYFPVYVANTEFVLGLASINSIKVVERWLDFIEPEVTELNQMSLILRNTKWLRGVLSPNADVPEREESYYSGFAEFWVNFKESIADGNQIQSVGKELFYHDRTSRYVHQEVQQFQQMAEELRVHRAAETLTVSHVRRLIDTLLEITGRFIVQEAHINRANFGPW
ncbi:hypothetical protein BU16DRAFT_566860 [Lophium mytilinum]|uniref:Uncharacterized protein n=1 Tax=Lophium mytilinum TaxID=390894 RepID=A0A6A6QCM7_9PEZI|nr:hypothetical protein BU16DRAFT_566860 [Lophium mytilinum]